MLHNLAMHVLGVVYQLLALTVLEPKSTYRRPIPYGSGTGEKAQPGHRSPDDYLCLPPSRPPPPPTEPIVKSLLNSRLHPFFQSILKYNLLHWLQ